MGRRGGRYVGAAQLHNLRCDGKLKQADWSRGGLVGSYAVAIGNRLFFLLSPLPGIIISFTRGAVKIRRFSGTLFN